MSGNTVVLRVALLHLLVMTSWTSSADSPPNILLPVPLDDVLVEAESTETPSSDGDEYDAGSQDLLSEGKRSEDSPWNDHHHPNQVTNPDNNNNFIRLGRVKDNFLRFGRAGNGNFLRFGKAGSNNFLRFGRADRNNFLRFGRPDRNFLRFGRAKSNFIRFGRGKPNNFLRFGRNMDDESEESEDHLRFGRGKPNNFLRFGRDVEDDTEVDEDFTDNAISFAEVSDEDENVSRVRRGGNPGNFIRFGRDRGSQNFIRLGKSDNFLRFGRKDNFLRFGRGEEKRSGKSQNLHFGRGKLADRNFIRLGRSSDQTVDYNRPTNTRRGGDGSRDNFIRLGNGKRGSDRPKDNFIRLGGKREDESVDDSVIRLSRDVESTDNIGTPEDHEENNSSVFELNRSKRSLSTDDSVEVSSTTDYNEVENGEEQKPPQMLFDNLQGPLRYYSPLTVGLPNYILAPEFSLLPSINGESLAKRAKSGGPGSNFIRLG
ncbi:FMRFamide-related peptides [Anabrus simplex]|uniref:FMRFamide-related peptides n=1 Tax=Anabrus simplex TaxID=316456 RepID=UPI0035A3C696